MRYISWNVNGIRACVTKGFKESFDKLDADIFAIQESKMQKDQLSLELDGYYQYWNYAKKKGYSGTAVFTRKEPLNVIYGMGIEEHDQEGRMITLEFEDFYFICVYVPNSQEGLKRLDYRMKWEDDFRSYILELDKKKPVIVCGDMNVAHKEIDLKNPSSNHKNPGFTDDEREKMGILLDSGFVDSFRYKYPDKTEAYSWWSYRFNSRARNAGWRIDYFLVSEKLKEKIVDASIHSEVMGSDHCPIELEIHN
ncbi:MAG: exodeoxyribonuclease III [Eubacterium sp.]|nr:exodeoxyribonuclease III [Eubacterium sp.]